MKHHRLLIGLAALAWLGLLAGGDGALARTRSPANVAVQQQAGPSLQGDVDCGGAADSIDALQVLRGVARLPVSADCLEVAGDTDCDGDRDSVDALRILRYVARLPNDIVENCAAIGEPLEVGPNSYQLIQAALNSGDLDAETALTYKIFVTFSDPRLPLVYQGDDAAVWDDPGAVAELVGTFDTLSPATQEVLAPFLLRPEAPGSWQQLRGAGAAGSVAAQAVTYKWIDTSPHVKVRYLESRPQDQAVAQGLANEVDATIWPALAGLMGEPMADPGGGDNGGDTRVDVELTGTAIRSFFRPLACKASSGFVALGTAGADKYVLTHELMHLMTQRFNVQATCKLPEYGWMSEATSQWAIDFVYKDSQEERGTGNWIPKCFLDHPAQSLEDRDDCHEYGAYLLFFYLARTFMPQAIRTAWENTATNDSLHAVDKALPGSFKDAWPEFALYNWNRDAVHHYKDWDSLNTGAAPGWVPPAMADLGGMQDGVLAIQPIMDNGLAHLSAGYYQFEFPDDNVRTVIFNNGFTFDLKRDEDPGLGTRFVAHEWNDPDRDRARVQALVKINGQWQDPEDWTDMGQRFFCRDKLDERIQALVLVFSNSQFEDTGKVLRPPGEAPTLFLSNMGCYEWQGAADFTSTDDGVTEKIHSNVTWSVKPPFQGTYFQPVGTADWSISGTDSGGCTYSGHDTLILDSQSSPLQSLATFNDYLAGPSHRAYTALGDFEKLVTVTTNCPSDDPPGFVIGTEDRPLPFWLQAENVPFFTVKADGKTIDDEFGDVQAHWSWHFLAQRE